MNRASRMAFILIAATMWAVVTLNATTSRSRAADVTIPGDASELSGPILKSTGVHGGLVVHLGCGDGRLTEALRASGGYLVHGLDADPAKVEQARQRLREAGVYGPVSVDRLRGSQLPYADNLVNLLVVGNPSSVANEEIFRVLCPGGVAVFTTDQGQLGPEKGTGPICRNGPEGASHKLDLSPFPMLVKPWPQDIDQWTHHLHDSGGNAVARDRVAGPPRHLQWTARPLWSRSHGWTPSVSAMVSAGGRLFYLVDETLTCVDGTVPDKWFLTARDAFSGVLLWKQPVQPWGSQALSGTPGTGAGSTTGRFTMPPNIGKRLVAVDDAVYVTLGAGAPVTALDAATGRVRRVYPETADADEILITDGRLIVALNPADRPADGEPNKNVAPSPTSGKRVCAVEAQSGKVLWNKGPFTAVRATRTQDPFGRLELAAGDGRVLLMTHRAIEALSTDTGESIWRTERPALPDSADRRLGFAGIYEFLLTVMVYHDGVVLLAQPEPNSPHSYHTMPGTLYAFDARDGRLLWKHAYAAWGHCTQPDVFVVDGLVWTHVNAEARFNVAANGWIKVPDTSAVDYRIQGLDLRTGALRRELPAKELFNVGHHHRCYRNKITERFLMASRRGVEFVDLVSGENYQNHWVRSGCLLGNLPCNGLLYVAPHSCGCYIEAKLTGFNALAPARSEKGEARSVKADERLFRGSAYKATDHRPSDFTVQTSNDWPTYRYDAQRSGATEAAVGAELRVAWQSSVGGRLSPPVVAGGRVLVADVDAHTVRALDAADGRPVWAYTAGARVASPPSVHEGLAFFGANDGRVYAVRAADGAAVWQFAAAPEDSRVTADNQLESPWPVPGVLVQDGKCWFAAGRSSYLDGGIHVFALAPATGRVLHQATIYHADPQTGKMPSSTDAHNMPGLLNDIPAGDGQNVFIRQLPVSAAGAATGHRAYSTAGYLDPTWFNRTYWKFGAIQTSGLMVLGRHAVYGMELYDSRSRETVFRPGSGAYRLVCHRFGPVSGVRGSPDPARAVRGSPDPALERAVRGSPDPALERAVRGSPDPALEFDRRSPETRSREVRGDLRSGVSAGSETRAERAGRAAERAKAKPAGPTPAWERHLPIRVTALVRAGDTLFAAGSPDTVDPADPHGAWEGRQGGVLAAFAAEDGRQLSELQLPSPPVWDGLAAANGKLYLTLMDGKVLCLAAKP